MAVLADCNAGQLDLAAALWAAAPYLAVLRLSFGLNGLCFLWGVFSMSRSTSFRSRRSSEGILDTFDSPEDETFFGAIGRLAISWGMVEAGIDYAVLIIHGPLDGANMEADRPRALKRKLKFLKRTSKELAVLNPFTERTADLADRIAAASEARHDIIHGTVIEHIERSGEAKLMRLIHDDPVPRGKRINVTTNSILEEASKANKLAAEMLNLASDLLALIE
jgi:hypothetical protein